MKLTQTLLVQHIGRHFKKHWRIQGKKVIRETPAFRVLTEKGIPIYEPKELFQEERTFENVNIIKPELIKKPDPNWHEKVCLTYKDENVLLEGLAQAKSLLKTVELQDGLPDRFVLKDCTKEMDTRVRRIIMNSHLFDAEQEKLPKIKDPARPAFNFPRVLGITEKRINKLIISKLLQLIELSRGSLSKERFLLNDLHFSFPFEKSDDLIQLMLRADTLMTSSSPLKPVTTSSGADVELHNLHPTKDTVTLNLDHVYEYGNIYPVSKNVAKHHPHTVFVHYNSLEVKNLYEEPVTEKQIQGRSLMKTFAVAASYAKQLYGDTAKELSKPVTVQCVHTDGRLFNFCVLQLNTLDLEGREGIKNIWYQTDTLPLFTSCSYVLGKPTLVGYNNEVMKHLLTFYDNI